MELVKVELELPKELHELGQGLVALVGSVKAALADGWQPGQDLPKIALDAMAILMPAIQGVEKLPEEFAADKAKCVLALSLLPGQILEKLL